MARPTKYTPELVERAKAYLTDFESQNSAVIPSHAGLANYLEVRRETLYDWAKQKNKAEFSNILGEILAKQEEMTLNGGLSGTFNASIAKLLLGKHGYSDKQDTQLTGAQGGPVAITYEGVKSDGKR